MGANIVDFNLLPSLDALLQEASVTHAAQRIQLTVPAMSRALGRLRSALGDDLLVRAGRQLVLTPAAAAMKARVHAAALEARALLQPSVAAPLSSTRRPLVLRCSDAAAALLCVPLEQVRARQAPHLQLRLLHEGDEDAASIRDGRVDLDVGVIDFTEPELLKRTLIADRFVGVARSGHALLRRPTAKRYAAAQHLAVSRRGKPTGPIDAALRERGLTRSIAAVVPDFLVAFHVAARTELVTAAPRLLVDSFSAILPIARFAIPVELPPISVAMAWHPRVDAEPAHVWLREQVQAIVRSVAPGRPGAA